MKSTKPLESFVYKYEEAVTTLSIFVSNALIICNFIYQEDIIKFIATKLKIYPEYLLPLKTFILKLIITFAVIYVILLILNKHKSKLLSNMTKELELATNKIDFFIQNTTVICEAQLKYIANNKLKFDITPYSERITLYIHHKSDAHFQPIGRYSLNQVFNKQGRRLYPDSEGCIGEAWKNGSSFHIYEDPNSNKKEWQKQNTEQSMQVRVLNSLCMKSQLIYACSLTGSNSNPNSVKAVVVVESTSPNRFKKSELDKVFNQDQKQYLANLVELISQSTDNSNAHEEGF